jgi:hypothetical protein
MRIREAFQALAEFGFGIFSKPLANFQSHGYTVPDWKTGVRPLFGIQGEVQVSSA